MNEKIINEKIKKLEERMIKLEATVETMSQNTPIVFSTTLLRQKYRNDAGFDIQSNENFIVPPHSIAQMIHTNLRVAIPIGYFGLIKERSGMSTKGIFVLGGVIDSGYRGEVLVNLGNLSNQKYIIKKGDRIAQLIIIPTKAIIIQSDKLPPSDRDVNGFGSSGK